MLHVVATTILTYVIVAAFSRNRKTGAIAAFVFNLTYLSCFHIYRMYVDYGGWKMDTSLVLMMNVAKHTSFAWCYKDGAEPREKLSQDQYNRKLDKLPSIFQYFSYIFFYASSLLGPAFDFRENSDFIHLRGEFANIPSSFAQAGQKLLLGLACMVITVFYGASTSPKIQYKPEYFAKPFYARVLITTAGSAVMRTRYYTAWFLATANCMMSGLSFNNKTEDGKNKWDRVVSVKAWEYESADNIKDRLEGWNYSVQAWLRKYVYLRIIREDEIRTNPKKSAFASNVTFMISAFWHGFYPIYYWTFIHLFLIQQVSKSIFAWRDKLRFIPPTLGFIIKWTLTTYYCDFVSTSFTILEIDNALIFMKANYFLPTILVLLLYVLFIVIGTPKKKGLQPKTAVTDKGTEKAKSQ